MSWTALIVDDEAPARKRLRDLIHDVADLSVVAECEDGPAAIQAIEEHRPDVLFLDVQMPEMTGFEVLARVGGGAVPAIVFVSAWDQHALAAFDHRALDYLLKPFTTARFQDTLDRVRTILESRPSDLTRRLDDLARSSVGSPRLPVPHDGGTRLVPLEAISWIEADGNYTVLHTAEGNYRMRSTMKGLLDRLGPAFVRIHASYIVRRAGITELRPWGHGEFEVHLSDGKTLVSSRTWSDELRRLSEG